MYQMNGETRFGCTQEEFTDHLLLGILCLCSNSRGTHQFENRWHTGSNRSWRPESKHWVGGTSTLQGRELSAAAEETENELEKQ